MPVERRIRVAGSVGSVKQLKVGCESDQRVGLARRASGRLAICLGHGSLERSHPDPGLLELRPRRLECWPVLGLQHRERQLKTSGAKVAP